MCDLTGRSATLKVPYQGYRYIIIIGRTGYMWQVEICGSGKVIEVYEDEFILD